MAQRFASAAEAELACPVCFQYYVPPHEPKNLPKCSHICCRICLKKMTEGGLKIIKCPQCNKESKLPDEGIDGLTTILAMRNLAEKHPEGVKQRKEYMQNDLDKEKKDKANMMREVKELEKQTRASIKQEEIEIEKSVETVMTQAQELISQIRNASQPRLNEIQERFSQLEEQIKRIEVTQAKLQTMPDGEFLNESDSIANQIEKLQINHANEISEDRQVCRFVANAHLGKIVRPRRLELIQEFGKFESACSIASAPNGLIAIGDCPEKRPKVIVLQNENGQYKTRLEFDVKYGTDNIPFDVAISPDGTYLITKCEAGFEVYSPNGKFKKTINQFKETDKRMRETASTATINDGRILMGSVVDDKFFMVTVHDPAGNILKTIPVSIVPTRIADIRGTHVAISDFGFANKVCVYDLQSGKETLNVDINVAHGICYDEQSDCMLIGRMTEIDEDGEPVDGSGVIEQYCVITGKLVACLAQRLTRPSGMTVTHDGMLAVVDEDTVKLYKMH